MTTKDKERLKGFTTEELQTEINRRVPAESEDVQCPQCNCMAAGMTVWVCMREVVPKDTRCRQKEHDERETEGSWGR